VCQFETAPIAQLMPQAELVQSLMRRLSHPRLKARNPMRRVG
jgi:hypothetical protein